ncbi:MULTISPECIES: DUF6216 family protein [Pseudomonas]|uniref:DUF6216 family protein n=1 Tax=Pseudomonas TaxID=286 RepID=UPI00164847A2|nr:MULTISPECIES: DUF6216 family protein [Pseudomonas]QXI46656.1 hypothetical protein HU763_018025 [Pseudomonas anuradhapurensis]
MTTPSAASTPLVWSAENLAPLGGLGLLVMVLLLVSFIHSRAGSLYFLRDLIWRSFGGKTEFDDLSELNEMRKELREIEFFRYEFNIPANNLRDARLAHRWIVDNGFAPSDIGRNRKYMDWSNFAAPTFAVNRFSRWKLGLTFVAMLGLIGTFMPFSFFGDSKYLLVHLKDAPDTPSFYLSTDNIKFEMWPDKVLTPEQCRSNQTLKPFTKGFPEKDLDTVCSFFMDPNYESHVVNGLKAQRSLLAGIAFGSMVGLVLLLLKLARMHRARSLYQQWQKRAQCGLQATPSATTSSPADTAAA